MARRNVKENEWKSSTLPNFRKEEFKCKCGKCDGYGQGIAYSLVELMQKVRNHYGKSITISSGYRCPSHNTAVGGDKNSNHQYGLACDFRFSGMNKQEVINYLKTLANYKYAYTNDTNMSNAVHITVYPTEEDVEVIKEEPKVEQAVETPIETSISEPTTSENDEVVQTPVETETNEYEDNKDLNNPLLHLVDLIARLFKMIFKR